MVSGRADILKCRRWQPEVFGVEGLCLMRRMVIFSLEFTYVTQSYILLA